MRVGAYPHDGAVEFRVWAPDHERVDLVLTAPEPARHPMRPADGGYFELHVPGVEPGAHYRYALGGGDDLVADPASRSQPDDVHGDSAVADPAFEWSDPEWVGRVLTDYVCYELHVGTFTPEGTFDAAIGRLEDLVALGVTAIELMPVAEFPGGRNWGYDGVFPFAVESAYGGLDGLLRLVDAAHSSGLSVVLDVVYNHLGPEGNILGRFGPYFTDRYRTPWGDALNFDGRGSDGVRNFFVENALFWVRDCRIDALRLDAVHAIADPSAYPFVEELTDAVHAAADELGRHIWVIAESSANDARLITPKEHGGIGCDAQWNDDLHHVLHVLLTEERGEYYADYRGVEDLAKSFQDGFVYTGQFSLFRGRRHGRPTAGLSGQRYVVFAQNHDQVGNRAEGDRLSTLVDQDALRVAAATVLCSPFVPLLFMGEEYGETNPFPYFVSHTDPELVEAVRRGRAEEFADFLGSVDPPDPQAESTFDAARLAWDRGDDEPHSSLLCWYRDLLRLRREYTALASLDLAATDAQAFVDERAVVVVRQAADDEVVVVLAFGREPQEIEADIIAGPWRVLLDSHGDARGTGAVLESDGRVSLKLPARSVLVCGRELPW